MSKNDLDAVARDLVRFFEASFPNDDVEKLGAYSYAIGSLRVEIYGKHHKRRQKGVGSRLKTAKELPSQLVADFADSCEGLVPAVVLKSLAAIRGRNWKIASSCNDALDPAYLWHRGALRHPSEAEDHVVAILLDELAYLLESAECGSAAGNAAIGKWIEAQGKANWGRGFGLNKMTPKQLKQLLSKGCAPDTTAGAKLLASLNVPEDRAKSENTPFYRGKAAFCDSVDDMCTSNEEFARRMSLRVEYAHSTPEAAIGFDYL